MCPSPGIYTIVPLIYRHKGTALAGYRSRAEGGSTEYKLWGGSGPRFIECPVLRAPWRHQAATGCQWSSRNGPRKNEHETVLCRGGKLRDFVALMFGGPPFSGLLPKPCCFMREFPNGIQQMLVASEAFLHVPRRGCVENIRQHDAICDLAFIPDPKRWSSNT